MREAAFWEQCAGGSVRCHLCLHHCLVSEGSIGFCGVRINKKGTLMTLVDDNVASIALDPVEKKPLFHFLPGTETLSIGTMGCNFACSFCQNFRLSRQPADTGRFRAGSAVTPESIVDFALSRRIPSLSFTYNEPTIFYELLAPTAELALERGLRTVMVTNGGMSEDCLEALGNKVTAANVDLKAWNPSFYRNICSASRDVVLNNLRRMRSLGWWIEVTTLIIPGLNDEKHDLCAIAAFIREALGPETPWHVSAFFPTYKMLDRPRTPPQTIHQACLYGRDEGLQYVYGGNVASTTDQHTFCPSCGTLCVERLGYSLRRTTKGICPHCGARLAGIWK